MKNNKQRNDITTAVRNHYGEISEKLNLENQAGCDCSCNQIMCCGPEEEVKLDIGLHLYQDANVSALPSEVTDISMGCGDPVTLASLTEGQTVLDLGSGGGIDCFLAAKKVGSKGKVIGVDMTPAMISRAQTSKAKLGADNVEFRLGEIENLPVEDNTVDVIISNCVINLSPDKSCVFSEAFRVLKPGGKLAVSDIVTDGHLPDTISNSLQAWAGCIAGAMDINDLIHTLNEAGFVDVDVKATYWEPELFDPIIEQMESELIDRTRDYNLKNFSAKDSDSKNNTEADVFDPTKSIFSAKITAWKPKEY